MFGGRIVILNWRENTGRYEHTFKKGALIQRRELIRAAKWLHIDVPQILLVFYLL